MCMQSSLLWWNHVKLLQSQIIIIISLEWHHPWVTISSSEMFALVRYAYVSWYLSLCQCPMFALQYCLECSDTLMTSHCGQWAMCAADGAISWRQNTLRSNGNASFIADGPSFTLSTMSAAGKHFSPNCKYSDLDCLISHCESAFTGISCQNNLALFVLFPRLESAPCIYCLESMMLQVCYPLSLMACFRFKHIYVQIILWLWVRCPLLWYHLNCKSDIASPFYVPCYLKEPACLQNSSV